MWKYSSLTNLIMNQVVRCVSGSTFEVAPVLHRWIIAKSKSLKEGNGMNMKRRPFICAVCDSAPHAASSFSKRVALSFIGSDLPPHFSVFLH
jgi:hypothetical protein